MYTYNVIIIVCISLIKHERRKQIGQAIFDCDARGIYFFRRALISQLHKHFLANKGKGCGQVIHGLTSLTTSSAPVKHTCTMDLLYFLDQNSQKRAALCIVAIALGGCITFTINTYIGIENSGFTNNPLRSYNIVGLVGEVFSVLCLVS